MKNWSKQIWVVVWIGLLWAAAPAFVAALDPPSDPNRDASATATPVPTEPNGPTSSSPASVPTTGPLAEIAALNKAYRQEVRAARKLLLDARNAKDGEVSGAQAKAKQAEAEVDAAHKKLDEALKLYVSLLVKDLDDEKWTVRERATAQLMKLGSCAIAVLNDALTKNQSPEVEMRLKKVLVELRKLPEDDEGLLHQWASAAKASSEYGNPNWSANQATGAPDTMKAGDIPTAWASKDPDGGEEWLELTYKVAVCPVRVRIRETYNPGAAVKVEAQDGKGQWHTVWKGKDTTVECPGWLEIPVTKADWTCQVIKVTLDTASVLSWNEIDAVELLGETPE